MDICQPVAAVIADAIFWQLQMNEKCLTFWNPDILYVTNDVLFEICICVFDTFQIFLLTSVLLRIKTSIVVAGPTLTQQWVSAWCLLG